MVVAGYPYVGMLSSGLNIATGSVSALSGMKDNIGRIQISAPIQPGNSGGPVFDRYGCVSAVVVSKLNPITLGKDVDVPQNVNFAINLLFLKAFLDSGSITYESPVKSAKLESADIADMAKKATFLIISER